jgi:hypothetical protein
MEEKNVELQVCEGGIVKTFKVTQEQFDIYQEEMRRAIVCEDTQKLASEVFLFASLFFMSGSLADIKQLALEDFYRSAKKHGYSAELNFTPTSVTIKINNYDKRTDVRT